MKQSRWLLGGLVAAILLFGAYYLWREEMPDPPRPAAEKPVPERIVMEGNTISESKDGQVLWELTAQTMEGSRTSQEIVLHNVRGVFHRPQGGTVELTAPQGVYQGQDHSLRLTGSVKAVSSDGDTLVAEEMGWLPKEEILYGQGQAQFSRPEALLSGDRIESDRSFTKAKVSGNARYVKQ